jgi:proteasome alpha subunit
MPSQQGYDRAITVFSPDGRLYQVEYAIETVKRGTLALGIKTKEGIIIAVEEKPRRLQISEKPQKLFQVDHHMGIAAAGYIPDARGQVNDIRFFSQSSKLVYDEPVDVETVAKYAADEFQHYTQYAGIRPMGVALIIGGVDNNGNALFLVDPSGTYVQFTAVAIGAGADDVNSFLEKNYNPDMSLEDAAALAIASINLKAEEKNEIKNIKMARVSSESKVFEKVSESDLENYSKNASKFTNE